MRPRKQEDAQDIQREHKPAPDADAENDAIACDGGTNGERREDNAEYALQQHARRGDHGRESAAADDGVRNCEDQQVDGGAAQEVVDGERGRTLQCCRGGHRDFRQRRDSAEQDHAEELARDAGRLCDGIGMAR
jgi:hypothetical protein